MSIIYDALKKVNKQILPPDKPDFKINKIRLAVYILIIFTAAAGWVGYKVFFENPKKAKIIVRAGKSVLRRKVRLEDASGILLNGIIYDKDNPLAIINNTLLRPGDCLGNIKVLKIEESSVVVVTPDGKKVLKINR